MKLTEALVLLVHILAYAAWWVDSRTIETWRNQRSYRRSFREHERAHQEAMENFDEKLEDMIAAERAAMRAEAMRRHPTAAIRLDTESMMEIQKKEGSRRPRKNFEMRKFWPNF